MSSLKYAYKFLFKTLENMCKNGVFILWPAMKIILKKSTFSHDILSRTLEATMSFKEYHVKIHITKNSQIPSKCPMYIL